jgi:CRP/FNR family cyclic AMP-dependent transcriptional regulator
MGGRRQGDMTTTTTEGIRTQLPEIGLEPGPWQLPADGGDELGYLIAAGTLLRRTILHGGTSVELLSVGDVLFPWREDCASFSCAELEVVDRARLHLLDLRPGSPLSRSQRATAAIAGKAIDRSRALGLQSAIMSIVGVEERLRALLWTFAERWGSVVPGGVEVEVHVPQTVLAEMVGARRPTVSLALGNLTESGQLVTLEPGHWILRGDPPAAAAA